MKKVLKSSLSLFLAISIIFGSAYVGFSGGDFNSLFVVNANAANEITEDGAITADGDVYETTKGVYEYIPRYEFYQVKDRVLSLVGISTADPTVNVTVDRVNYFDISKVNSTTKVTNNGDGTLTIAANNYQCVINETFGELCPELKSGDVVTFTVETNGLCQIHLVEANQFISANGKNGKGVTLTEEMLNSRVIFYGVAKTDEDYSQEHKIYGIQVEKGFERTNREEYLSDISNINIVFDDGVNTTDLKTNADGFAGSIIASSTSATITSNNPGINIFCEYMKKQVNVVALGDSIVFGMNPNVMTSEYYEGYNDMNEQHISYMQLACDKLGYNFTNYGICASTVARKDDADKSSSMALRYTEMPNDIDLVYVAGGSNDWYYNSIPLGTNEDRDVNTFYGALHMLCKGLKEKYPNSLIVFATPIKRWIDRGDASDGSLNIVGESIDAYCLAIKEVCAMYDITVHDMHNELSFNPWDVLDRETYIPDGVHPNLAGHKIMQSEVEDFLLPVFGHDSSDWIIDISATCTSNGTKHRECINCGKLFETEVIFATGHTSSDWIVDEAAICTEDGSKHKECTVCGDTLETGVIPATGHTSSNWLVYENATCTTVGSKHKECSVCGYTLETETIPAIGHTSSNWIIDTNATVNAPGSKHKECTVCGETLETVAITQLKPATPNVVTENTLNGILVKWNVIDGAVKYNIYRRNAGETNFTYIGTTTDTTFTDMDVISGRYYCYTVRSFNNAGQYSDYVSANTNTRKYMAVPKLKGISNATNGLYITWNPVAGVTNGYRVYRRGAGSTYWTYLGTTKNTYFTDTQVKNNSGEYFRYTVIADGGYHSKFDTTGLYLRRLSNPTLKSAVSSKTGITVKWTPVKGCLGYYVYRKTANSGWVRIAVVNGANASSYLDKTAKKGVTYTYTVRAVCGSYISYFNSGISCKDKY